ncbi:hypothetical protein LTR53_006631 [Teratosphaeriaceae sp. CCFEE 6253]|nr:hypothetical protein LTR53_006631 [Teratosphaeriaceae sp. CCFEE 6253]
MDFDSLAGSAFPMLDDHPRFDQTNGDQTFDAMAYDDRMTSVDGLTFDNDVTQPPLSCCFITDLFGANTPGLPCHGTAAALDELVLAITRDKLFVQRLATANPGDSIKIAYQHLEKRGEFPSPDVLHELQQLPTNRIQGGQDIFHHQAHAAPLFKVLDVDKVLAVLHDTAKRFETYTDVYLSQPQKVAYQLGVITMTLDENDKPHFEARLFPSRDDSTPAKTLWMYRWCINDSAGGHEEHWRALGDGTFDPSNLREHAEPPPTQPSTPISKGKKRARRASDVDDRDVVNTGLPTPESLPFRKRRLHADEEFLDHEPAEHLFADSPDLITGPAILNLARFYSNQELFERINIGLAAKGLPLITTENVITRRITVAIGAQATKSRNETGDSIRAGLQAARTANGVKARMYVKTKLVKEANRAAREL